MRARVSASFTNLSLSLPPAPPRTHFTPRVKIKWIITFLICALFLLSFSFRLRVFGRGAVHLYFFSIMGKFFFFVLLFLFVIWFNSCCSLSACAINGRSSGSNKFPPSNRRNTWTRRKARKRTNAAKSLIEYWPSVSEPDTKNDVLHSHFLEKGRHRNCCAYELWICHKCRFFSAFFGCSCCCSEYYFGLLFVSVVVAGVVLPSPSPQRLPVKVFNKIAVLIVYFIRQCVFRFTLLAIFLLATSCALWKLVPNTIRSNVISGWVDGYGFFFRGAHTHTNIFLIFARHLVN